MGKFAASRANQTRRRGIPGAASLCAVALCAVALAVGLGGCRADRADWLNSPAALNGPWSLDGEVVYFDPGRERLIIINESTGGPRRRAVAREGSPPASFLRVQADAVGGDALLLLDPGDKTVDVYRAGDTTTTRFDVRAPFTAMRASADGRAVLLYHGASTAGAGGIVNTAEVGLLRLDAPPSDDNPQLTTIAGFSRQPTDATVSAPLDGDGGSRRLIWLTAASLLGFADLSPDSEPRGLIVPLAPPDSNASITPREVQSVVRDDGVHLYLVASGSSDMVHIRLRVDAASLDADIDQIASGADPRDLHVYETADGPRVLTINRQSRDVAWLDPATGSGTVVTLETQLDRIVPWVDDSGRDRALLWASSGNVAEIALVDVVDLPKRKGKAIDRVLVDQPVSEVVAQGSRFLLRHGSSNTGLSVYDAGTDKRSTFGSTGSIRSIVEVGGLLYALGDFAGGQQIAALDLQQLSGSSEPLDLTGSALMRFGDAGLALQGSDVGGPWLLILPAAGTSVDGATWLRDLTIDGFLSDGGAS